ncbi:PfkB family carbohydrate kinase [Sphaerisporangium viridialbum]|uniref:PfkB family carbohydrate kinase n=1 Tax=Sphaerisporangium viridialbum TaxID=46189 RepID=UPI003C78550D
MRPGRRRGALSHHEAHPACHHKAYCAVKTHEQRLRWNRSAVTLGEQLRSTVTHSLAGDGPITAITARKLGLRTALSANHVGADTTGSALLSRLDTAGVQHRLSLRARTTTSELTVVTDQARTRTWLAHLTQAYIGLADADLTALTRAKLAYIDCYQVLTTDAARAITAAAHAGVPLMLNLGGDPLHPGIQRAASHAHPAVVQTSLPEHQAYLADEVADDLAARLTPAVVLVTLGSQGAIAHQPGARYRAPAGEGPIAHTHGAGAAFSAGFAASYLAGHDIPTALHHACRTGTAHCAPPGSHPGRPGDVLPPSGVSA